MTETTTCMWEKPRCPTRYGKARCTTEPNFPHTDENDGTNLTESDDKNQQTLWSLFASMEKTFGDFSLEGGLRFDLADYKYFHGGQLQEDVSRNYTKLLPYFEADYDGGSISLSLSYSSNIRRPSYSQLNGSTMYVDKYTYQRGNPLLQSAYDHILDFMCSWKDLMVNVSHTWYKNSIMQTNEMICNCKQVSYADVESALHQMERFDDVLRAFDEVQKITHCSTGCGGCHDKILDTISEIMMA